MIYILLQEALIVQLNGHESNIICLIKLEYYGNDGYNDNEDDPKKHKFICSCSNDRTIKVWEGNP